MPIDATENMKTREETYSKDLNVIENLVNLKEKRTRKNGTSLTDGNRTDPSVHQHCNTIDFSVLL